jgi:hypothetical protein
LALGAIGVVVIIVVALAIYSLLLLGEVVLGTVTSAVELFLVVVIIEDDIGVDKGRPVVVAEAVVFSTLPST